jgi:hypothetical protein
VVVSVAERVLVDTVDLLLHFDKAARQIQDQELVCVWVKGNVPVNAFGQLASFNRCPGMSFDENEYCL